MSKQLIVSDPSYKKVDTIADPSFSLAISEFFGGTIQGEGVSAGVPAVFLRLQGCTLNCKFCDTAAVWKAGNRYSFGELFSMMESHGVIRDLKNGAHLVITGGSPLKQQKELTLFLYAFIINYEFHPFIEIENECVVMPDAKLIDVVDQWNNSPKLQNSGIATVTRLKPSVILEMSKLTNSCFKFVISREEDWVEIEEEFLKRELVKREQIILMPCGETREELRLTRELAIDLAVREGVRYSDRLHIVAWDKKTGV